MEIIYQDKHNKKASRHNLHIVIVILVSKMEGLFDTKYN